MAFGNPMEAYLEAARQKRQNQQDMIQNLALGGQGIGEGLGSIGQAIKDRQHKDVLDQIVQAMKTQGAPAQGPQMAPIQGPSGYLPPGASTGTAAGQSPAVGLPQDNTALINSLMMQYSPELGIKSMYEQNDPYKRALTDQAKAEAEAKRRPPKLPMAFKPYGESDKGTGLTIEETTGKITDTGVPVKTRGSEVDDWKRVIQQDHLEQQAISRVSGIKGDASLARTELQRDAAIQAYKTIAEIKAEGRLPSQIEYYDIIGQMWKARTGQAPTDQAIKDLDAKTFKGDLGKATQFFTGKPAGRTTEAVLANIQNFAKSSGQQADKLHEGYMRTHLIKPAGLDDDRWQPILNTGRGTSFAEAIRDIEQSPGGGSGLTPEEQAELQRLDAKYGGKS
jgi:hypothetical protein